MLMKLEFSLQIFEKCSNIKFHENPCSGSQVIPCGQTDRHNEVKSRFPQFCEHDIGERMLEESCRWLGIVWCRRTGRWGKMRKLFNFRRYTAGTNEKSHAKSQGTK